MFKVNTYLYLVAIISVFILPLNVFSQEQITVNFRFNDPGKQYERVFIPGSFNDWGPNTDGQIAADAPSLMTYDQQGGFWQKEVTLNTDESFQYKFHVHKNSTGSSFEWLTDPLSSDDTGSPDFNSIVRTSDPMFFQTRKGLDQENKVFFKTRVASSSPITSVTIDISGVSTDVSSSYNESASEVDYQADIACEDAAIYRLLIENEDGEMTSELVTCGEGSFVPDWAKDAVWYQIFPERFRNGDPTNDPIRSSLEAPQFNNAPSNWAISPWEGDWYDRSDWEQGEGGNFYNNGVFLRRYGGDLQGVIDQLDYLEELGINAIYFNPVFWGPSLHKFDVASYHHIDPHFGPDPVGDKAIIASENENPESWSWTTADLLFLDLLTKAKEKNIRVIIDGVFNHSGRAFFAFQDLLANQQNSPYADWYDVISFDDPNTSANEFSYNSFFGFESLPEYANEAGGSTLVEPVRSYFFDITKRWMDPNGDGDPSDGIDGWRLDASALVPDGYWAEWNNYVRTINPDAYTTLEEFGPAADLIENGFFSAAMNYQGFTFPIQGYFIIGESNATQFWQRISQQFDQFGDDNRFVVQNLVDSHDTERIASMMVNNSSNGITANPLSDQDYLIRKPDEVERYRQKLAALFQIGYIGAPMFYYGTESGMWGATDPDDRMPMNWPDIDFDLQDSHPFGLERPSDDVNFDQGMFNYYKSIINIRHQYEATRRGEVTLVSTGDILVFKRVLNGEEVYFAFNNQNQPNDSQIIDPSEALEPVFFTHGNPSEVSNEFLDGTHSFELPAYSGVVFAAKGSLTINDVPVIAGVTTAISADEDNTFTIDKSQFDLVDEDDELSVLELRV
ncbi:MAG: glycoside hydrolase family 13 protein, partial [Bacteroidota bacterium]